MSSTPASFNASYFSALTFDQASCVNLPPALPENSVLSFTWHQLSSPSTQPSSVFHPIPHLNDLRPIFRDFDKMQQEGFNTVRLVVRMQGSAAEEHFISFDKLRSFAHIHNNTPAINSAAALYRLVQSLSCKSEKFGKMVNILATTPIQSYTMGFLSTEPLWTLGCLAWDPQEQDIFDTVVDLRLEATALQLRLLRPHRPVWVLAPTMFIHSLRQLYSNSDPKFNSELHLLQTHIRGLRDAHNFAGMVFLDCDGSHWVSYVYDGTRILGYGDSLGRNRAGPSSVLLQALNWFLHDAGLPLVDEFTALDVSVQSPESRSCALAAFNAAERVIGIPGIGKWGLKDSNTHRIRWIEDILTIHIHASEYSSDCPWYSAIQGDTLSETPASGDLENSYAWPCWNSQAVLATHPFCQAIQGELISTIPTVLGVALDTSSLHAGTESESDLSGSLKAESAVNIVSQSSLASLSPADGPPSGAKSPSAETLPPLDFGQRLQSSRSRSVIDLTTSSSPHRPIKRRAQRSPSVVILSTSEDESLSPPPRAPGRRRGPGKKVKRSRRKSSSVIIISDSDGSLKFVPQGPAVGDTMALPPLPRISSRTNTLGISAEETPSGGVFGSDTEDFHFPPTSLHEGQTFATLDDAVQAVLVDAEERRIVMRRAQKFDDDYGVKKVTIRCQCYQKPRETHNPAVHPGDQRHGRSNRTNCKAHVNINRVPGSTHYHITLVHDIHNHAPVLPEGGHARRAATTTQREIISRYANASKGNFNRRQVEFILEDQNNGRQLEPRQISNAITAARRQAREDIAALGGDVMAILEKLEELHSDDPLWRYRTKFSEDGALAALWWQSPEQAELLHDFPDILINDCTYNRNQYGYPISIGVGIDRLGHSRNFWYAIHAREDAITHEWILQNHLNHAPSHPEVFASDRDPALEAVVPRLMPTTYHIVCLHHMEGNLTKNVRSALGSSWDTFKRRFWEVYRAVSPEIFERLWQSLLTDFPAASNYLSTNLYPIRQRWAHAWISSRFTAGIRTNGRVEAENRTNKILGGPKTTLLHLFQNLNDRTQEQVQRERNAVRDGSHRKHPSHWEPAFARVLTLCETYLGGFGLQTVWREMEKSCAYHTEVIPVPPDLQAWSNALHQREAGFEWTQDEEKRMINTHENDGEYISLPWLIHQVTERRLDVRFIVRATLRGTAAQHIVLILSHDRWLRSSTIDPSRVSPMTLDHVSTRLLPMAGAVISNPLHVVPPSADTTRRDTPAGSNQTLAPQEINHRTQSALKVATRGITTQAELDHFMSRMAEIEAERQEQLISQQPIRIRDPPALNPRGRPRTSRLAAAAEGTRTRTRSQAHAAAHAAAPAPATSPATVANPQQPSNERSQNVRRCGKCRGEGHDRRRCPN